MNNTDQQDSEDSSTITIINCALNAPLMLISILGNALVLAAIIRTPSIRSPHMIMLCSLAVSDLLVGLIAQPIYIAHQLTEGRYVSHVWKVIGPFLCGVSLSTITAITVDRFLALHYHMRYATLVNESRIKYTLIIVWLISLFVPFLYFWKESLQIFLIGIFIVICLLISAFSYIEIYRIVRRHQLQIHAQQAVQTSDTENNLNITRLKRSALNTFVFYIVLIICYFPVYIVSSVSKDWKAGWKFSSTLVFSNSCINPFLYCWRLSELRAAIVKTGKQALCQQTEVT